MNNHIQWYYQFSCFYCRWSLYYYLYHIGNCPTSSTFDVTVLVTLSITYSAAAFCEDGGNTAAPTVVGDPGSGTFAATQPV